MPRLPNTINLSTPEGSLLWDAVDSLGGNNFPAGETITPGHVVKLILSGGVLKWFKHVGNGAPHTVAQHDSFAVAVERPMQNRNQGTDYASGETVAVRWYARGGMFLAMAKPSTVITLGDLLIVDGIAHGAMLPVPGAFPGSQIEAPYQALETIASSLVEQPIRVVVIL